MVIKKQEKGLENQEINQEIPTYLSSSTAPTVDLNEEIVQPNGEEENNVNQSEIFHEPPHETQNIQRRNIRISVYRPEINPPSITREEWEKKKTNAYYLVLFNIFFPGKNF